jgi:hypothetical protein
MTSSSLAALVNLGGSAVGALDPSVATTTLVVEHGMIPLTAAKTVLVATQDQA